MLDNADGAGKQSAWNPVVIQGFQGWAWGYRSMMVRSASASIWWDDTVSIPGIQGSQLETNSGRNTLRAYMVDHFVSVGDYACAFIKRLDFLGDRLPGDDVSWF